MAGSPPRQQNRRTRRLLGWLAWVALLLAVALGGQALGRAKLTPPPLTDPGSWASWAGGRTPLEATFAVLALVVVVFAWYLLVVTTLAAGARLWGARRLISVMDVITLPVIRRSIHAALGVGLVGSSMAGVAADPPLQTVAIASARVAAEVPPGTDARTATTTEDSDEERPPVMRMLPDEVSRAETPASGLAAHEWEVRPGDHLWSVAVQVLQRDGAGAGTDGEVGEYWNRLIVANRDRLADPNNPDLIFPGQILTLPIPSPTGEGTLP